MAYVNKNENFFKPDEIHITWWFKKNFVGNQPYYLTVNCCCINSNGLLVILFVPTNTNPISRSPLLLVQ